MFVFFVLEIHFRTGLVSLFGSTNSVKSDFAHYVFIIHSTEKKSAISATFLYSLNEMYTYQQDA